MDFVRQMQPTIMVVLGGIVLVTSIAWFFMRQPEATGEVRGFVRRVRNLLVGGLLVVLAWQVITFASVNVTSRPTIDRPDINRQK
jgi:hypothetical protein